MRRNCRRNMLTRGYAAAALVLALAMAAGCARQPGTSPTPAVTRAATSAVVDYPRLPGAQGITTPRADNGTTATPVPVPARGVIAFTSNRDGNSDIYLMNADGGGQRNLTRHPAADDQPAWSPDGRQIAFSSNRDGNFEIYVMNADGSGLRNLTNTPTQDEQNPVWSPDGRRIACTAASGGAADVLVLAVTGGSPLNLSRHPARDSQPAWSPDGAMLAFTSERDGNAEIYVVSADGGEPLNLSASPATADWGPAWRPDGRQLLYLSGAPDGPARLRVINPQGGGARDLAGAADDTYAQAAWSPDGRLIAAVRARTGVLASQEVVLLNADGSFLASLTDSPAHYARPAWQPDGAGVLFDSPRDGSYAVYYADIASARLMRLTTALAADFGAVWKPGTAETEVSPQQQPGGDELNAQAYDSDGAGEPLNIRRLPSTDSEVLIALAHGTPISLLGRSEDSAWLWISEPYSRVHGWLNARYARTAVDISALPVVDQPGYVSVE